MAYLKLLKFQNGIERLNLLSKTFVSDESNFVFTTKLNQNRFKEGGGPDYIWTVNLVDLFSPVRIVARRIIC